MLNIWRENGKHFAAAKVGFKKHFSFVDNKIIS